MPGGGNMQAPGWKRTGKTELPKRKTGGDMIDQKLMFSSKWYCNAIAMIIILCFEAKDIAGRGNLIRCCQEPKRQRKDPTSSQLKSSFVSENIYIIINKTISMNFDLRFYKF